jgi:hypothetical protein
LDETRLSVEFRLLTILSRTSVSPDLKVKLEILSRQSPNWKSLVSLAESHGVLPLVTRHLKAFDFLAVDKSVVKQAESVTKSGAIKSFFLASELLRLQNEFQSAGISFIAFKGPALAQQAFGDTTIRTFSDLDLIVAPEQLTAAVNVLSSLSMMATPSRTPAELSELLQSGLLARLTHEHTFVRTKSPIAGFPLRVDLHWNVAPVSFEKIEYAEIAADPEAVVICGQKVDTMNAERCLVALAIHATKHQFADLKWLIDIAELAQRPNLNWDKIDEIANSWQATKIVDLSIYLASMIGYDLHPTAAATARMEKYPDLEILASDTIEIWSTTSEIRTVNLRQYYSYSCLALGSWRRALLFLLYELFSPNMVAWQTIKLPAHLFPFYYFISPLVLGWNFLSQKKADHENDLGVIKSDSKYA